MNRNIRILTGLGVATLLMGLGSPETLEGAPGGDYPVRQVPLTVNGETTWPLPDVPAENAVGSGGVTVLAKIAEFRTEGTAWVAELSLFPNPRGGLYGGEQPHRKVYIPTERSVTLRGSKHGDDLRQVLQPGVVFDAYVDRGRITGLRIGDWAVSQLREPRFQRGSRLRFQFSTTKADGTEAILELQPHCVIGADYTDYGEIAAMGGADSSGEEFELAMKCWSIVLNGGSQVLAVSAPLMEGRGGDGGIAMESLTRDPELGGAAKMLQTMEAGAGVRASPPPPAWIAVRDQKLGPVPILQRSTYGVPGGVWDHNGSTVGIVEEAGELSIVYLEVRPGLKGIIPDGSVLFVGGCSGSAVEGNAHRFKKNFPPIAYPCRGGFNAGGDRLVLRGMAPKRDSNGKVERMEAEELIFTLKSGD